MRIVRVTTFYRGFKSQEKPIVPGVYTEDDPRLFGLADYLVNNQQKAVWVQESASLPLPKVAYSETIVGDDEETPIADADDESEGDSVQAHYTALRVLMDKELVSDVDRLSLDSLRAEVSERGLMDNLVATGSNGRLVKADFIKVLEETILQ